MDQSTLDSPSNNPTGSTSGSDRVYRGGSWYDYAGYRRSANRGRFRPSLRDINDGFRVCLSPSGK